MATTRAQAQNPLHEQILSNAERKEIHALNDDVKSDSHNNQRVLTETLNLDTWATVCKWMDAPAFMPILVSQISGLEKELLLCTLAVW